MCVVLWIIFEDEEIEMEVINCFTWGNRVTYWARNYHLDMPDTEDSSLNHCKIFLYISSLAKLEK